MVIPKEIPIEVNAAVHGQPLGDGLSLTSSCLIATTVQDQRKKSLAEIALEERVEELASKNMDRMEEAAVSGAAGSGDTHDTGLRDEQRGHYVGRTGGAVSRQRLGV